MTCDGFGMTSNVPEPGGSSATRDWSTREVELIVADYLSMLTRELTGQTYSKSAHRRDLLMRLDQRKEAAVEFKHCNISAVMLELGFPYLRGYKPRNNFQRSLLVAVVSEQVAQHRVIDEATMAAVNRPAEPAETTDFSCWVPCDHLPIRSWPLFRARDVMRGVVEAMKAEQTA